MKILLISEWGKWLGVAQRLILEGHDVTFTTYYPSSCGDGLVKKLEPHFLILKSEGELFEYNLDRIVKKVLPDLVIIEGFTKIGSLFDYFRKKQLLVYGGGLFQDVVSENPSYASTLWKKLELEEDEVMGFWNGVTFTHLFNWWEEDTFMGRNSGPEVNTGGVGRIIKHSNNLNKFRSYLTKMPFRGCIGINKGQFSFTQPLSFFEVYAGKLGTFFFQLAKMETPSGRILSDFFLQNLITLPPYPYGENFNLELCKEKDLPYPSEALKHTWLNDVKQVKGKIVCAGESGRVGWLSSRGLTVKEGVRRIMRTLSSHPIENLQFRTDLGLRVQQLLLDAEESLTVCPKTPSVEQSIHPELPLQLHTDEVHPEVIPIPETHV